MLKLGPQERPFLTRAEGRPYPEFVLQRWEAKAWKVYAAEEFNRGEGQVVISIQEPGTYRVVAAVSPYVLYESQSVQVREGDKQVMTTLQASAAGAPCEVRMTSASTGKPLAGLSLALSGPYSSLPPLRGVTDSEGRLKLGPVRASELHLEWESGGAEPRTWEIAQQCRASGRADLRVP